MTRPVPQKTRRLLLLTTPNSYRTPAFLQAAQRLGIEVRQAVDMPKALAEHWGYQLGVDFNDVETAAQELARATVDTPVDAVLALDDSGALLAARTSQLLRLPHNAPEAAEAARNKQRMREMLAAGRVASPASSPSPPPRRRQK